MPILGAFKSNNPQPYDPIAANQIQEISMWTNDIRYLSRKSNTVADWLSRPPGVPLGAAYALPSADFELSALQEVALELINRKALAKAQLNCPDVISHRQGKAPRKVKMTDIEYSPGVTLYCDTSDG